MTNEHETKSRESDGKSDGKVLNLYNKYRTSDKYNKSDAVARIANESGYSQKEVRGILRDSEKSGKYVYSRKIDGILSNEIYEMKNAGADAGLISRTLGISERSVYKHNKAIADENTRRSDNYNGSVLQFGHSYLRAVGADAAGESGRERMLRKKREASAGRLPAVSPPGSPEAEAAREVAEKIGLGEAIVIPQRSDAADAPAVEPGAHQEVHLHIENPAGAAPAPAERPYAEVVPTRSGKPKVKRDSLSVQMAALKTDVTNMGNAVYGVHHVPENPKQPNKAGLAENYLNLSISQREIAADAEAAKKAAVEAVEAAKKTVEGLDVVNPVRGTPGRVIVDAKEEVGTLSRKVDELSKRQPGFMGKVMPYVALVGGLLGLGYYVKGEIDELKKALDRANAGSPVVSYTKAEADKAIESGNAQVTTAVTATLDARLAQRDAADAEKDKGLEAKLNDIGTGIGKLNDGQQDLNKKYDTLNATVADGEKARKTDYANLDKNLRGYTDKVANGINSGMAVLERYGIETRDLLNAHINAGNKPVAPVAPKDTGKGKTPAADTHGKNAPAPAKGNKHIPAPAKPADYVEFGISDLVGSNANEARMKVRGSYDGLTLDAQALDSRHATELGRTDLTAGKLGADYSDKAAKFSVGGKLNVGIETESRSERSLSVDNVNDGTVLRVDDDYNSSEKRTSKLGSLNVHGTYKEVTLGLTATRRESNTRDNVVDNTLVTFDPSTGLVPLNVSTGVGSRSRVTTNEFRVEAGVKPVDGVYAALIGGNSSTRARTNLNVNGAPVYVESQSLDVPTVGGKADVSVAQLDAGVAVLGHFGNDIPSDSKFDTNANAVIDKVVADLSLGAEATFKDGGVVGGGMAAWNVDRKALRNVMSARAYDELFPLESFDRQKQLRAYDALIDALYEGKGNETSALLAVRAGKANSDGRKVLGVEAGVRVPKIITDGGVAAVISYEQHSGGDLPRSRILDAGLEFKLSDYVRADIGVMFDETDGKKTVTPGFGLTIKSKK